MKTLFGLARHWLSAFLAPRQLISLIHLPRYIRHWFAFSARSQEKIYFADSYPCLADWLPATPFDPHYFFQGAWLARRLAEARPDWHVDIGSSVLCVGVMSAHVPTVFVDYRPLKANLSNLDNVAGNIVSLPFAKDSLASLSCMHVLEHIGLGRYGDPLDPEGSYKAAAELARVVAPGGRLYLTTPVGRKRICFNAHRVFSPTGLLDLLPGLTLRSFSWVDDAGIFHAAGQPADAAANEYACGMYEFEKVHD